MKPNLQGVDFEKKIFSFLICLSHNTDEANNIQTAGMSTSNSKIANDRKNMLDIIYSLL